MTTPIDPEHLPAAATRRFTNVLAHLCRASGYRVSEVVVSGNLPDGSGWVFEATDKRCLTFNIEVAGSVHEPRLHDHGLHGQ